MYLRDTLILPAKGLCPSAHAFFIRLLTVWRAAQANLCRLQKIRQRGLTRLRTPRLIGFLSDASPVATERRRPMSPRLIGAS